MSNTRLNKERYAVHGEWTRAAERRLPGERWLGGGEIQSEPASIVIDVADLLEKQSGHVWRDGAFKVTLTDVPDMRSKTFYGETAWSDAARYAADAATKCGDWRWWPDL